MCKLVWKEKVLGMISVKEKQFKDAAERFRFIMQLEKTPSFVKVLEMNKT